MGDEASQTEFFSDVSHKLPIYVEFTGKTLTLVKAKIQNREGDPGDGHEVNYDVSTDDWKGKPKAINAVIVGGGTGGGGYSKDDNDLRVVPEGHPVLLAH